MKLNELSKKILKVLPKATFGEDGDGQIVIYTNLKNSEKLKDMDCWESCNQTFGHKGLCGKIQNDGSIYIGELVK